jgi:hypothetical protein
MVRGRGKADVAQWWCREWIEPLELALEIIYRVARNFYPNCGGKMAKY